MTIQDAAAVAPTYTLPEIAAIFAGIVTVIAAMGASVVNVVVALKQGTKIDAAAVKTDALAAKVEEVHNVTNSGLSAVKAELKTSNELNSQLREIITDLKAQRGKAEVATALATPVPAAARHRDTEHATVEILDRATDQLTEIETNTKQTAANTTRAAARHDDKKGGA